MVDTDQGIKTAIRRIREVLLEDPAKPRYVGTVIGKGYRFIAEVKESRPDATLVAMPPRPGVQDEPEPELEASAQFLTPRSAAKISRRAGFLFRVKPFMYKHYKGLFLQTNFSPISAHRHSLSPPCQIPWVPVNPLAVTAQSSSAFL
jgi:hypothetical protein